MFLKPLTSHCLASCSYLANTVRHSSWSAASSQRAKQHSWRGGQNLSERYVRLEKALRGKSTLESESEHLRQSTPILGSTSRRPDTSDEEAFLSRGIVIPEKPKEPQSDECCMSGCAVCVYDLYEDSLNAYREAVAKVAATLNGMGVPKADWPRELLANNSDIEMGRSKDVTLSVFEKMELEIQRRKQAKLDSSGTLSSESFKSSERRRSLVLYSHFLVYST
ncbi:oxidoreductase-like protein [Lentinula raphanica]|nr:oxidoreductase-like protein [Lentinula raphanica]